MHQEACKQIFHLKSSHIPFYEGGRDVLYVLNDDALDEPQKMQKTLTSIGDNTFTTCHTIWDDGSASKTLYIASGKRVAKNFDINEVEEGAYFAITENGGMTAEVWDTVISHTFCLLLTSPL